MTVEKFSPKMFPILILVSIIFTVNAEILITKQGILNGTYLKARNGKTFNAYFGIPFAEPPVGHLRFKAPVAAKSWNGVRDASFISEACTQTIKYSNETMGSEDCLYLNVYTPLDAKKGTNLSVILYLYGGVYKSSWNFIEKPNYMLGNEIILVMPNYREGVLGFLSTGDSVIPGNFGLKDQNMALQWVRDNIYDFGGDPNKVTLYGHSSGAVSAHLHTLSPMSKGLFHKVIIQSGNAFCSLSYFGPDIVKAIAKEFAERAGCNVKTSEDILSCVMSLNADIFPFIQEQMYVWDLDPDAAFRPCIESKDVEDAFVNDFPENLPYQTPDLPWIIGMTTGEGAFKAARYLDHNDQLAKEIDENYKLLFPITLQYLWNTKTSSLDDISQIIRTHYFQNQSISSQTAASLTNLYTNGLFGVCTIDTILTYPGLKYVYWYDYRANFTLQNMMGYYPGFLGVSHGDEVHLFFYKTASAPVLTPQDVIFSDELIKRWLNFVDSGNPNEPKKINESLMSYWDPMSTSNIEYLLIHINGTMQTNPYEDTYQFWRSLPIKNKYQNVSPRKCENCFSTQ